MTEPIHIAFEVECPAAQAFTIWTARIDRWWPLTHTVSTEAGLEVRIEPRVGGRIFERTPSGAEHDWGEIVDWEPPRRFAYRWHLRQDRADASDVEIRFVPLDIRRTRVEIDHRGWERLGARAQALRQRNVAGWDGMLPHYIKATQDPEILASSA